MTVDQRTAQLFQLAAATRRAMDAVVRTDVGEAAVDAAIAALDQATDQLSQRLRPTMPWPNADEFRKGLAYYNPVIGRANPYAPPMAVSLLDDGSVQGQVTLGPIHEGPPGFVHGGIVSMLLDQFLGHVVAAAGVPAMTAELTVRFRRPTPFGRPLLLVGRAESIEGRKTLASAQILADDAVTAEGRGVFLQTSAERFRRLAEVADQPRVSSSDATKERLGSRPAK